MYRLFYSLNNRRRLIVAYRFIQYSNKKYISRKPGVIKNLKYFVVLKTYTYSSFTKNLCVFHGINCLRLHYFDQSSLRILRRCISFQIRQKCIIRLLHSLSYTILN